MELNICTSARRCLKMQLVLGAEIRLLVMVDGVIGAAGVEMARLGDLYSVSYAWKCEYGRGWRDCGD